MNPDIPRCPNCGRLHWGFYGCFIPDHWKIYYKDMRDARLRTELEHP